MTREQIRARFEELHRRIAHAIAEYENDTGEQVADISISRSGGETTIAVRPVPR